jgi:hypothetical protein
MTQINYKFNNYSPYGNNHVKHNNPIHSCGYYDHIKWLSNLYPNKLSLGFNNYHF